MTTSQAEAIANESKQYVIETLLKQAKEIEYAYERIEGLLETIDKLKRAA